MFYVASDTSTESKSSFYKDKMAEFRIVSVAHKIPNHFLLRFFFVI